MAAKRSKTKRAHRFRVGDRVSFEFGLDQVTGTIIEDRGPLGRGGARLFAIQVPSRYADDLIIELPAGKFRAA